MTHDLAWQFEASTRLTWTLLPVHVTASVPTLPWLEQDKWGCEREPAAVPVVVMENDKIRAAVTPQWGGKIWSSFDKVNQRQMCVFGPVGTQVQWLSLNRPVAIQRLGHQSINKDSVS